MKQVQNGRFFNRILKLQNHKRWIEHKPEHEDNSASKSFKVAVYTMLAAYIERDIYKTEVDVERAVCSAVFHNLNRTGIGRMKYETQQDEKIQPLLQTYKHQLNLQLVSFLSSSMQEAFTQYIVNAEDSSTIEGRLVTACDVFEAMVFCHREVIDGKQSKFFRDKYEELSEKMKNHELASIRYLKEEFDKREDFYNFMYEVMEMDQVDRWDGKTSLIEDHDATHIYRSTAKAIYFAVYEKVKHGVDIDLLRLVGKTLTHDLPEIRGGDTLGPTKDAIPGMKEAFEELEGGFATKIVNQLPSFLRGYFDDYMVEPKSDDYEGMMVDIVDKIDALIKANRERKISPIEYEVVYRKQLKKVQHLYGEVPCVLFFLAFILPDLDDPMIEEN